jgi:hypothetical protein
MYKQSTPSLSAICAVNPSYTPGHAMNLSGSANMFLNFWTAVTFFSPLLSETEPIFPQEQKVQLFEFISLSQVARQPFLI